MNKEKLKVSLKLRSGFFATLFVLVGVVFVWRGVWHLIDTFLFPGDPALSAVLSILIGVAILYLPDNDIKELL